MKTQVQSKNKTKVAKKPSSILQNYKVVHWSATISFILFTLYMTLGQNPDLLWKLQDLDLFVMDRPFFSEALERTGGLSMYMGSFLNQFFYFPWIGTMVLVCFLLMVSLLTGKTFKLKKWLLPLAHIPSLALLLSLTDMGYMIYYQKLDGFVFNNILGVIVTLSGFLLFRKIRKTPIKGLYALAYLIITYPISGAYALFSGFLMLLTSVKKGIESKHRSAFFLSIFLLTVLVVIPIGFYHFVFDQLAFGDIYSANLPYFKMQGSEIVLWLPYLVLAVFMIWMVFWKEKGFKFRFLPALLFLSSIVTVFAFSYKDKNFNAEISMLTAVDHEDWNKVLKIARNHNVEPTRLVVMTTNLALYKLGLAGDKAYHYKNGSKEMNSPRIIVPIHIAGTQFYHHYGLSNYCIKWCMEGVVEYGFNASVLKYFVLSSLMNGDVALARKYNEVLKATLFYSSWAKKQQQYIDHPELITDAQKFKSIQPLTAYDDVLNSDYYHLEAFLRNHFSMMTNVSSELTELSVLYNLEIKNNEQFWPRLFRWVKLNPDKKIPVHFQEAALLFADLQKMDLSGAPFDKDVVANFVNFMDRVRINGNYPEETLKEILYTPFGNTYWYYYFFMHSPGASKKNEKDY